MKKLTLILFGILVFSGFSLQLNFVNAQPVEQQPAQQSVCEGIGLTATSGNCEGDANSPTANSVIHTVITILTFIVGIASIIMIVLGGFKYITSGGDSGRVTSAKSTITYALIGLVIAILAQVLVRFVFHSVTTIPTSTPTPTPAVDCGTNPEGLSCPR